MNDVFSPTRRPWHPAQDRDAYCTGSDTRSKSYRSPEMNDTAHTGMTEGKRAHFLTWGCVKSITFYVVPPHSDNGHIQEHEHSGQDHVHEIHQR